MKNSWLLTLGNQGIPAHQRYQIGKNDRLAALVAADGEPVTDDQTGGEGDETDDDRGHGRSISARADAGAACHLAQRPARLRGMAT